MTVRQDIMAVLDHEFDINKIVVDRDVVNGLPATRVAVTWRNREGSSYVSESSFAENLKMDGQHMGEVLASYMRHNK